MSYRHDQDRQNLQRFIGSSPWDHQPLQQELARQVGVLLDLLLRQECDRRYPGWLTRWEQRKNTRREPARLYHYKRHNLLAPLRVAEIK